MSVPGCKLEVAGRNMAENEIRSSLQRRAAAGRVRRLRRALEQIRAIAADAERISVEAGEILAEWRIDLRQREALLALISAAGRILQAAGEARRAAEIVRARQEELESRLAGPRRDLPIDERDRAAYRLVADAILRAGRATTGAECAAILDQLELALAARRSANHPL